MLKRLCVSLGLLAAVWASAAARGQATPDAPPADEQQLMMQQMQRFQEMIQKMQEKGIDPQQFFQQIGQQMQDGSLDRAGLEKMLIDKGIVDQKTLDDMQSSMKTMAMLGIKRRLEVSDEDWKALQPAIERVMVAMSAAGQGGPGGGMMMMPMMGGGPQTDSDVTKAQRDLRAAINDPKTSADDFSAKIQAVRDAHEKAQAELAAAQKDLTSLLTVRQESVLALMGLL